MCNIAARTITFLSALLILSLTSAKGEKPALVDDLAPWLQVVQGVQPSFHIVGKATPTIDGKPREISFSITRYDDEAFDLSVDYVDYAVAIRRRSDGIAFALPLHQKVFIGSGKLLTADHLRPAGVLSRLISNGSAAFVPNQSLGTMDAETTVALIQGLTDLTYSDTKQAWSGKDNVTLQFMKDQTLHGSIAGSDFEIQLSWDVPTPPQFDDWADYQKESRNRDEIEQQLTRGVRRALEVLLPSNMLTTPSQLAKQTAHGELRWIGGQRVVILHGTPEEIGQAHGELLARETQRCIDSVLYAFGTVQTIVNGRWFRDDLEQAYTRLSPHIPERHKQETVALAQAVNADPELMQVLNVFPELFHCSGFAIFGSATADGKLYHGRVLDYMTTIGLQDAATTFIVAADGQIPFANIGYAGFIGSVSGMNLEQISLGEMGGHGEGQWDGVPMATLMRRALEECDSLDSIKHLWATSPRTCEYFYVFADGETKTAVGVAATPESIEFVEPGAAHERLGEGIPDAVVLSAGSRLEELRRRVQSGHGAIDLEAAKNLMCRPVAMKSNLHNVLFVPEDYMLFVANADHAHPAADRPYVAINLLDLLKDAPGKHQERLDTLREAQRVPELSRKVNPGDLFTATDTIDIDGESRSDAAQCLRGLCWTASDFTVSINEPQQDRGDLLVRYPSPFADGHPQNDSVAMEWYQAKDAVGNVIEAPAVVVIHESGSGMTVGRLLAKSFQSHGVHAFMLQLPYYGLRRGPEGRPKGPQLMTGMRQGIADARRARDAVAALPYVRADQVSIQGTSLGGFVTATTGGLDDAYHRVIILLAGGDLFSVLMEGDRDAGKVKAALLSAGLDEQEIRDGLFSIEPLRVAHRLVPSKTWLFTGAYDTVVPPSSSKKLAKAASLAPEHHVEMLADHYTGIIYLPMIAKQMSELIKQ